MIKLYLGRWAVITGVALAGTSSGQEKVPEAFSKEDAQAPTHSDSISDIDPFDPDVGRPKYVQVQVEFVEMSHLKLTELLFLSDPASSDATPLRKQVVELVKKGEAEVLETMMVVARSGEKATSEGIREFIYPTEYEPPEIPSKITIPGKPDELSPEKLKLMWMMRTPATPTAFETRNLGSTLEIAPTLGENDKYIDLQLAPEIVWHTGNTVWVETKDGLGNVSRIEMPQMYKLSVNTAITCLDNQYNLIAILSPKDQKGVTDMTRKVMVFVKCDIQVVKEGGE
ncbi:hypothetical protein [Haloferula sp.]|uniref:hypothetical protein n=1 Tax=Haloferula sp. TaxID=2497595 RepID=UPI003C77CCA9